MTEQKLLPCPFCGSSAIPSHEWAQCSNSACPAFHIKTSYFAAWNRRAAPAEDVPAARDEPVAVMYDDGDVILPSDCLSREIFDTICRRNTPLYRNPERPVVMPKRLREVWLFLDGQAELNGCVFGEKPEGRHNFWWRKELRAVLDELYPQQ